MGEAGATSVFLWIALFVTLLWVIYLAKRIVDAHNGSTPVGRRVGSLRSRILMWRAERRIREREHMAMRPLPPPVGGNFTPSPAGVPTEEATASGAPESDDRQDGALVFERSDSPHDPSSQAVVGNGHLGRRPAVEHEGPSVAAESQDVSSTTFEAVELVRGKTSVRLPDQLEHRVIGRYHTCLKAILRIEAERQNYRKRGDKIQRWFYIRGPGSGEPLWFVEGIDSQKPVIDLREERESKARRVAQSG